MIRGCAAYARGSSHVKSGKVNQDSFCILPLEDKWIAAVADGVGSTRYADKASSIATETVMHFINDNWPVDDSPISVKSMLRTAFNRALVEIRREAEREGNPLSEYETTLMVVVYDGTRGYYAHVGDGAVIGRRRDGTYRVLTTRQQTEDSHLVVPLSAGYGFWEISEIDEDLVSLVIATDGVADRMVNSSLGEGVYVPLMMLFDPYVIQYLGRKQVNYSRFFDDPSSTPRSTIYNAIYYAMRKGYGFRKSAALEIASSVKRGMLFKTLEGISDDKTAVCLYNSDSPPRARDVGFYTEPDWRRIYSEKQRLLYPSLDRGERADRGDGVKTTAKTPSTAEKKRSPRLGRALRRLLKKADRNG